MRSILYPGRVPRVRNGGSVFREIVATVSRKQLRVPPV